jgi:hypothetical protein
MARRDGERVLRALQAEPADRQEAATPVPEEDPPAAPEEAPPAPPLVARRPPPGAAPAAEAAEEAGDLRGRPGELLRTLRQGA